MASGTNGKKHERTNDRETRRRNADCIGSGGYKAWPAAGAEPEKWNIALEEKDAPAAGRPGIWGSPFSGTPIRFDDLAIAPVR